MIKIFNSNEKLFLDNGLKNIKPLRAIVFEEDNGDYYLELTAKVEDQEFLQIGNILRVKIRDNEQSFRINKRNITKDKISIRANHIYYDSANYTISDTNIVNKTLNDALDQLIIRCDDVTNFKTLSDVNVIKSARIVRKTLQEAINILIERWGGHLVRDNFNIEVREDISKDKGYVVNYSKNMLDIDAEEDWDEVCTKILPVGKDGLTLDEKYIESEYKYDIPYTRIVKFDQNHIDEKDYKVNDKLNEAEYKKALKNDLEQQAKDYLTTHAEPRVSYKAKAYILDNVEIGNMVEVKYKKAKMSIMTNVISITYDVIAQRVIEFEFGNFKNKLKNLMSRIKAEATQESTEKIEKETSYLKNELSIAKEKILSKIGSGHVIVEKDKILIVDTLPVEDAQKVMMWSPGGISFSKTGIDGEFTSAWALDGTLDMETINVINLTASLIKGGTLKLGSIRNEIGNIEVYDNSNNLIGTLNEEGLCIYGTDQAKLVIKPNQFYACDENDTELFAVRDGIMNIKKTHISEELTLASKIRWVGMDTEDITGVGIVTLI